MNDPHQIKRPVRVLFQELTEATVRKIMARSANASTGGGARDLRLSPHDQVEPFMRNMLSREGTRTRRVSDGGPDEEVTILVGRATWGQGEQEVELEYWPPTASRGNEGRIASINRLPSLAEPPPFEHRPVMLFVQDEDDLIWVRYTTAEGLHQSASQLGDFILRCLDQTQGRIASGYIDLTDGGLGTWCNGMPG